MARLLGLLSYFHMTLAMVLLTIAAFAVPVQEARADYAGCCYQAQTLCTDPYGNLDNVCYDNALADCCDKWIKNQCMPTDATCLAAAKANCMGCNGAFIDCKDVDVKKCPQTKETECVPAIAVYCPSMQKDCVCKWKPDASGFFGCYCINVSGK